VYAWAVRTKVVKDASKEIVLYGQSVGSVSIYIHDVEIAYSDQYQFLQGPSCYLASRRGKKKMPVAGMVLASGVYK
jgi:hypothetical protein